MGACEDRQVEMNVESTSAIASEPQAEPTAEIAQAEPVEQEAGAIEEQPQAETGAAAARARLEQWQRAHPNREWIEIEQATHTIMPPADNSALIGNPQGHTYGLVTERDVATWERETTALVTEGSRIFHSADLLGSTISVSCDMCHPDAANTHPETYPKYQVQLGRVILLRDMINWCIEQAVKGPTLDADDPNMRALEAYIYAQRRGTPLDYGRR